MHLQRRSKFRNNLTLTEHFSLYQLTTKTYLSCYHEHTIRPLQLRYRDVRFCYCGNAALLEQASESQLRAARMPLSSDTLF
jgi:hypothetical protein